MEVWWESLSTPEHFFYYVAIPATVVLVIQTILTFMGGLELNGDFDIGGGIDLDMELDADGDFDLEEAATADLKLFSVRGIVAFFTLFGWVGVVLLDKKVPLIVTVGIAILSGGVAMYLIAWIFRQMYKLQESGNIDIVNAEGKDGEVYLTIPKYRSGVGKVQMVVQGRLIEIDAVTDDEEGLVTGTKISVITTLKDNKVVVERK